MPLCGSPTSHKCLERLTQPRKRDARVCNLKEFPVTKRIIEIRTIESGINSEQFVAEFFKIRPADASDLDPGILQGIQESPVRLV